MFLTNFVFEGGNDYMTVLKNWISGLLKKTKGRISACADNKKTVIMILSQASPIWTFGN